MIQIMIFTVFLFVLGMFKSEKNSNLILDFEHTNLLKGYSILIITLCHIAQAIGIQHVQFVAAIGVAVFMFCSGYGLSISYQKNGLEGYWRKKCKKIIMPYYIIKILLVVLFSVEISVEYILKLLTFQHSWFVAHIMLFYIFFYILCVLRNILQNNKDFIIYGLLVIGFIYCIVDSIFFCIEGAESLRVRQILPFVLGVYIGFHQEKICKIRFQNMLKVICMMICGTSLVFISEILAEYAHRIVLSNLIAFFSMIPFVVACISITDKYMGFFVNNFIRIMGDASYEIFLIQGSFMFFLQQNSKYALLIYLSVVAIGVFANKAKVRFILSEV